jgi:hypothetical protein
MNESPPAKKRNHRRTRGKAGHPPFVPTPEQRHVVSMLVALRVNWDEIRKLILNPHRGNKPITKGTLNRHFKRELDVGSVALKQLIASKYYEALEAGESWAIRLGMRNKYNWVIEGSAPPPTEVLGIGEDNKQIQIQFVMPTRKEEPPAPPINVSPSQPEQPITEVPRIEGPRPRFRTATGAIFEAPAKPTDWMK